MKNTNQIGRKRFLAAVGAGIARKRLAASLTQEEVAARLDIGNEAISRIERGVVSPTLERLLQFAELFDCRVDELLLEASDRSADQAAAIAIQLAELSQDDRALVAGIVDQLSARLRKTRSKPKH